MKIALYLGSFNPFHNGHYKVVLQAIEYFKMDSVIIVPAMQNPFKKDSPISIDNRVDIINHTFFHGEQLVTHLCIMKDMLKQMIQKNL